MFRAMRKPHRARSLFGGILAAAISVGSSVASAQSSAGALYDQGSAAFAAGRYQEAADAFARADELAPNDVALESALKSVVLADDPALGMTLVERAEGRATTPALVEARDKAKQAFQGRASKVILRCPATDSGCTLTLEGKAVEPGVPHFRKVGSYGLTAVTSGESRVHTIEVAAGRDLDFTVPAAAGSAPASVAPPPQPLPAPAPFSTAPTPAPDEDDDGGLSPAWFWVGLGATIAAGGATAGVGAYTLSLHSDFEKGDDSAEDPGRTAQTATNVLIGLTGALAVTTVVLGVVTLGGDDPETGLSVELGPGHAGLRRAW
jgi:hypothetical protein